MITLRDFIFINTKMLDNYVSTIDGYLADEFEYTESEKDIKGGKLGYTPIVEGNASNQASRETRSKRVRTPQSQFQKLYEVLENNEQIKHIDLINDDYWGTIQKGDILEIQAKIRIPDIILQLDQFQNIVPYINMAQKFGTNLINDKDILALEGINDIQKIIEDKSIPLIFQSISNSKYKFASELTRDNITGNLSDFQGEAVVFGKVQQILIKGQKQEIFNFLPDMQNFPNINRQQRLALKSNKNNPTKNSFTEILNGPAITLAPLAIYR